MNEILDELPTPEPAKAGRRSSYVGAVIFAFAALVVVASGVYIGNTLFGSRSLDVMLDLYAQRDRLGKDVRGLQEQNAALQKEYFELIGLDPDSYKNGVK